MKPQAAAYLMVGVVLSLVAGCTTFQPKNNVSSNQPTATPPLEKPASPAEGEPLRPENRVIPISIEGHVIGMELKLFNQKSLPFTTYVPSKDFTSAVGSSGEGTGVRFYFSPKGVKDEKAYVHIFLPAQAISVEQVQDLIVGEQGLLASNGWELVDRTDIVSYPWAKEKLIYRQRINKKTFIGAIYVGEDNDKAFYALTYYPAEYSNQFEPRSTVMLENLQFRDQRE
jgi:hypothetical protein